MHEVRDITRASGTALIFDEVITGFRAHPGGAQAYFGVAADLATYGKVVGGGMPIGVIAGRNPWMWTLFDGGQWRYGDASIPTAGVTYLRLAPSCATRMTMAAAHAALRFMKAEDPALQERLNAATTRMAGELNALLQERRRRRSRSVTSRRCGRPSSSSFQQPYGELLFCYLRDRGVPHLGRLPMFSDGGAR